MLQRFVSSVKEKGIKHTSTQGKRIIKQRVSDMTTGNRFYYQFQSYKLMRDYKEEVYKPVWISPDDICYLTGEYDIRDSAHLDYTPYFKPRELDWSHADYYQEIPYRSSVGGDWDTKSDKFKQLTLFESAQNKYKNNKDWDETEYFQQKMRRYINKGNSKESAKNIVHRECNRMDELYQAIQTQGYSSQKQLGGHPLHEVTVNLSRDGEWLYNCEGRHRLTLAKISDVEKIPALILAVHKNY